MVAKGGCILDAQRCEGPGSAARRARPSPKMWQSAGAQHRLDPPSNEIYDAFQTGVVGGTDTSLGTFNSLRLYELANCLTAPGNNALWIMYEPLIMSKKSFDHLEQEAAGRVTRRREESAEVLRGQGRSGQSRRRSRPTGITRGQGHRA